MSRSFGRNRQGPTGKMDVTCQAICVPCVMPHISRRWIDELDVSRSEGEENGSASPPTGEPEKSQNNLSIKTSRTHERRVTKFCHCESA
jgi:hypothetical protein